MPPPIWIGVFSPTALIISRITFSFFGLPATAPFRSTMCRRRAPSADQCLAIATGSSENTVAESMRPCCKRTQWPSFRSIAGMISTGCCEPQFGELHQVGYGRHWTKLDSNCKPLLWLFSGWNCTAKMLSRATAQVKRAP